MPNINVTDDNFEGDVLRLLRAINAVLQHGMDANRRERLEDAAAAVDAYYESDDPMEMGWIGKDGRP